MEDNFKVITEKFQNHPSILITTKNSKNSKFGFALVTKDYVAPLIKNLHSFKTCQKNNVPASIIKEKIDIISDVFHRNINKCISEYTFPNDFKFVKLCQYLRKLKKIFEKPKEQL